MRKWTILLLTAALALFLSACSGGNTPPADSGNSGNTEGNTSSDTSATPEAEKPLTSVSVNSTDSTASVWTTPIRTRTAAR